MSVAPSPGAVLFDLDGTLLDTAPDMVPALNSLLVEERRTPLPYEAVRRHVSHGVPGMLRLAFGEVAEAERGRLQQRFRELYAARLALETRLFEGMAEVLETLEDRAIPWGVVTNKPAVFTEPLLIDIGLRARCACVVSGDTLPRRKPDPDPLLHALGQIDVVPATAVYVGDAARDITAGRSAGMRTIAALYGYIPAEEDPALWGADHGIDHPLDLLAVLALQASSGIRR
jgi:phosphoglycolate phosphatase